MSQSSAGEKTEKGTAKKRRDARNEGQVLKSTEVNTAFSILVMFGFLLIFWPTLLRSMTDIYYIYLSTPYIVDSTEQITVPMMQKLYVNLLIDAVKMLLPILICSLIAGVVINVLQVGFLFTTKPLMPKLEKISPLKGIKRIFSSRTIAELFKSLLKVFILAYILYTDFVVIVEQLPTLMGADIHTSMTEAALMAFRLAMKMGVVLAIIAAFDFLYQWWKHEKDLKMTKQEVKDEYKLMEGDPLIKSKIRQKQRQMSAMRMMEKVPSADVVITNPTHYAVALKYEEGKSIAPVVVAKGKDFIARKIKEKAKEHGIEMVENRPLAQSLYSLCEVGQEIPPELYQAVADILVYVFRQKNRLKGGNR